MTDFFGILLAGGAGRRMGGNKPERSFRGSSLRERARGLLLELCDEVWEGPDDRPGLGPLGGILTGLERSGSDWNLVLAVDYPLLRVETLRGLWRATQADALLIERHPLIGYYHRRLREPLAGYLESGGRKVFDFLKTVQVEWVPGPQQELHNFNTPEDFKKFSELDCSLEE